MSSAMKDCIKAIFFDFDGVLTRDKTGSLTTLRYLSEKTGIDNKRLRAAFAKYNNDLNLGKVTHEVIWPDLCSVLGVQIERSALLEAFDSTPMNSGMVQLAHRLKKAYSVGIITDNKKDRIDYLKERIGLARMFDSIVVSAEVGSDKTSSAIFEQALNHFGIAPCESVFIDNSKANLFAPSKMGMHTIYFADEANDIQALVRVLREQYGVQVPVDA